MRHPKDGFIGKLERGKSSYFKAMMPYSLDPYHLVAADAVMPVLGAEGFIEKAAWLALAYWALYNTARLYSPRVVVPAILYVILSFHSSKPLLTSIGFYSNHISNLDKNRG